LRINLFNRIAVSCKDSLDPGPKARAGQDVPGEEPHHLLDLPDQILQFVARPLIQRRPKKMVKRVAVWGARRPDLLHSHLRKALLEPVLHPLAVLGRSAVLLRLILVLEMFISCAWGGGGEIICRGPL
jgi:hypothetical protein